jgi:signal transduction histidine kinase
MMPILNQKQLTLDVDIEPDLVPVFANEDKLEQVLLNLIDNAAKFTPNGGKLRIKAATDSKWCRVVVADNGIGIRKEDQARVFEPFCQLEHQDTTTEGGTGLGLALVKQIVENYGGTIIVDSEYGQGSRFIFTIPLTNGYQRKKNRRNLKREHQDTACRG